MGGAASRLECHVYHYICIELTEDCDHAVKGETAKLRIADARKFGMGDTSQFLGIAR